MGKNSHLALTAAGTLLLTANASCRDSASTHEVVLCANGGTARAGSTSQPLPGPCTERRYDCSVGCEAAAMTCYAYDDAGRIATSESLVSTHGLGEAWNAGYSFVYDSDGNVAEGFEHDLDERGRITSTRALSPPFDRGHMPGPPWFCVGQQEPDCGGDESDCREGTDTYTVSGCDAAGRIVSMAEYDCFEPSMPLTPWTGSACNWTDGGDLLSREWFGHYGDWSARVEYTYDCWN